ncbi:MAG: glycosyltransferase family 4 protein [Candidatus Kaelpia aquatica]|nr:glycosyltransferase family 4 protein [Candidatus Kaelpia aquatica]
MKIIVSTHDSLAPLKGGGAIRTLRVAREFKRRGHDVVIVAPTDAVSKIEDMSVEWLHPPRKQRSQILSSIKFNIRLMRKFLWLVEDADIFFIHNTISAVTIPFLKMFFSFKFVLDITDIHAEYLPIGSRNILERIISPYLIRYEYWIISYAEAIIVATHAMKDLLIKRSIAQERIKVIYDGVDAADFNKEKDIGANKNIIHLGAIDRQHGVDLIVKAAAKVIQEDNDVRFLFIGGGREFKYIKGLAKELGLKKYCFFSGILEHSEVIQYLKKASIGIIPRKDYLPNRIVTTLKIYEYWASATAVIASSLKGLREIAEDHREVIFFQPGDSDDLANKITLVLNDSALREKVIKNGLSKVKNFSWQDIASAIVDLSLNSSNA